VVDEVDKVEEAAEQTPRWGLGDVALGWLVGVLATAVVAGAWAGASGKTDLSLTALAVSEAALWVGLVGAPIWASRHKGTGDLGRDFGFSVGWSDAGLGVPIGIATQLLLVPLIYLPIQWLAGNHDLSAPAKNVIEKAHGPGPLALLAVVLIVGAPIAEELFFRGLLLRAPPAPGPRRVRRDLGDPRRALRPPRPGDLGSRCIQRRHRDPARPLNIPGRPYGRSSLSLNSRSGRVLPIRDMTSEGLEEPEDGCDEVPELPWSSLGGDRSDAQGAQRDHALLLPL
jgi:hypothetical protein